MSGRLTTHVLDISRGCPAAGMRVQLFVRNERGGSVLLRDERTNGDGRLDRPLLADSDMQKGGYELVFWVGEYFAGGSDFLDQVPVRFRITDPGAHYHVPLLAAPGGYSTYRGS